jgi:hypothetical protein
MKVRWKLLAGVPVLLLLMTLAFFIGLLWEPRSDAEEMAALIRIGMTSRQVAEAVPLLDDLRFDAEGMSAQVCAPRDHSTLIVSIGADGRVFEVRTWPPTVSPLTRPRRILARIIPALGE